MELSSDLLIDVDDAGSEVPLDLFVDEVKTANQPGHWRWLWPVVAAALIAGAFWLLQR